MKKILFACAAATLMCVVAAAQNAGIAPIGIVNGEVSLPQTTLYVDIVIEQQDITAGPYARYAQKYLGISAPLANKVLYEIKSAKISDNSGNQADKPREEYGVTSHMRPESGFPKLAVDKKSNTQVTPEESAQLAANEIFKIRKSRDELIMGEAGENVFGAGLKDAVKELNRMEEEYLSLFIGRQVNKTITKQYKLTPISGKQTYIVCRFSNVDGLLPEDNLSGQPVVLETKALGTMSTEGLNVQPKPAKGVPAYRVADDTSCRIIFNNSEIASVTIPVYQFGKTVYIAP